MQQFARLFKISAVYFLLTSGLVFSQDSPADKPPQIDPGISTESAESQETPAEEDKTEEAKPVLQINPAYQSKVNEQFHWTQEDPSFLYETRFIPDIKTSEEFLPVAMEKEVIKERIEEEKNFRESLKKIQIRLPDMKQSLVLVAIIIIIWIYRARAKKQRGK